MHDDLLRTIVQQAEALAALTRDLESARQALAEAQADRDRLADALEGFLDGILESLPSVLEEALERDALGPLRDQIDRLSRRGRQKGQPDAADLAEARRLRERGVSIRKIARQLNLSERTINRMLDAIT